MAGLGISLLIYLVPQLSFLVSVLPDLLSAGWANLSLTQNGVLGGLAIGLGLGWMVMVLLIDAALLPAPRHGLSGCVSSDQLDDGPLPAAAQTL